MPALSPYRWRWPLPWKRSELFQFGLPHVDSIWLDSETSFNRMGSKVWGQRITRCKVEPGGYTITDFRFDSLLDFRCWLVSEGYLRND
jgi:hypothetical protein